MDEVRLLEKPQVKLYTFKIHIQRGHEVLATFEVQAQNIREAELKVKEQVKIIAF